MKKLFRVQVICDVVVLAESLEQAEALLRDNTLDWRHELGDADYSATEVVSMAQIPEWMGCLPYTEQGSEEKPCEEYLDPPGAAFLYVIYRPVSTDYPGMWMVCKWQVSTEEGTKAEENGSLHPSLEAARRALPPGLTRVARDDQDDPRIEETWL